MFRRACRACCCRDGSVECIIMAMLMALIPSACAMECLMCCETEDRFVIAAQALHCMDRFSMWVFMEEMMQGIPLSCSSFESWLLFSS